jgi:hypothetical protein
MTVQAVIDEKLGTVLQGRFVGDRAGPRIEANAISGEKSNAMRNFFMLSIPISW